MGRLTYRYDVRRHVSKVKKRIAFTVMSAVFVISSAGVALLPMTAANALNPTNWNVTGTYTFDFVLSGSHYLHDATITSQYANGSYTIGGGYPAGAASYSNVWNGTGSISGNTVTNSVDYSVGAPGTHMNMTGTIANNGKMSGTWSDNYGGTRSGTWSVVSGNAVKVSNVTQVVTANDLDGTSSSPAVVATDGLNKWFMYNDNTDQIDNTLGSFVYGPSTPVNGQGSVAFTLGASTDRNNIATYQFGGQKLSGLTTLSYTAYSHSGVAGANESPYLNFNVDFTGTGTNWQKRLVYVPSANMATVPQDSWNTYDTLNNGDALWNWSGFAANGNKWPDGNTNFNRTVKDLVTAFPGIRVIPGDSWLGVRVGEPGPTGYTGNVDSVTVGAGNKVTTFDFEPTNQPNSEKDCRNNGWKNFNAPVFSSQKACDKWLDASAVGNFKLTGGNQKIKFNVENSNGDSQWDRHDREDHDNRGRHNTVEYWDFTYPEGAGTLHYKAAVSCTNINPVTKDARFVFQIPAGHGSLSGLYVVAYTKEVSGHNNPDVFGFNTTTDKNVAQQWCETGVGFSPSYFPPTTGNVEINTED